MASALLESFPTAAGVASGWLAEFKLEDPESDPKPVFQQCERAIESILAAPASSPDAKVALFKQQWLPEALECALYRQTKAEHVARTARFLGASLRLIVEHSIPNDEQPLLHVLLQMFDTHEAPKYWAPLVNGTAISYTPRLYHDHFSRAAAPAVDEPSPAEAEASGSPSTQADNAKVYISEESPALHVSRAAYLLVDVVNEFGRLGGFAAIVRRLESRETCCPRFGCLLTFARLTHALRARLERQVLGELVWVIKENAPAVLLRVEDRDLKVLTRADYDRAVELLQDLLVSVLGVLSSARIKKSMTMLKLELHFAWLCSGQLEKRLLGLGQLRDAVDLASRRTSSFSSRNGEQPLDLQFLLDWLDSKDFVGELFGPHMHVELLKRASNLLRVLAQSNRVTTRHLTSLWQSASGAHEAVQRVLFDIIADLVPVLAPPLRRFLFEHISSLPPHKVDEQTLDLVFNFTVRASQLRSSGAKAAVVEEMPAKSGDGRRRGQVSHTPAREMYGLRVLWKYLQDAPATDVEAPPASVELTEQAVSLLVKLLRMPHFVAEREPLMQQCLENLQRHTSVETSMSVLQNILSTYPPRRRLWVSFSTREIDGSISGIIEALERTHRMLASFFHDLQRYQEEYRACCSVRQAEAEATSKAAATQRPSDRVRIRGAVQRFLYDQAIGVRLQFLTFILTNSSVTLGEAQVAMLWDNLVNDSLGLPGCQETALQWFQVACASMVASPLQASASMSTTGSSDVAALSGTASDSSPTGGMVAFSESVLPFLFQSKLQKLKPEIISRAASKLYTQLFLYVNARSKALRWVTSSAGKSNEWVRQAAELQGEKFLWELMLKGTDSHIVDAAMNLLIELNHRISPKLTQAKRDRISGDFVRRCIHRLSLFVPYLNLDHQQGSDGSKARPLVPRGNAPQFVSRCVLLLQQFLERYHEHPYRQIRVELVTGRSDRVITELHLPSAATVGDLRNAAADYFKEEPDIISLSRPAASRFSSAETLDNDSSNLDTMKFQSRPTVIVQKIMPARGSERKETNKIMSQADLIKLVDMQVPHIDIVAPRSLLSAVLSKDPDIQYQWEHVLPPPLPYKDDMVLAPGLARPLYGSYTTPAATVPLETHLEQFPDHFEQLLSLLDLRLDANPQIDANLSAMVWRILQALPTHMTLLRELQSLKAAEGGSWKTLFDASSLFKTLCALHIIDAFITAGATHPANCKPHFVWASKFLHLGGVEHLTSVLASIAEGLEADVKREAESAEDTRVEARVSCVAIIHRVLHLLLDLDPMYRSRDTKDGISSNAWGEHRAPSGMVVSVIDVQSLVTSALNVLLCIVKVRSNDAVTVSAAAQTMQLVLGLIQCSPQGLDAFCRYPSLGKWLHAFTLRVSNVGVRHSVCSALLRMCSIAARLDRGADSQQMVIHWAILRHLLPLISSVSTTREDSALCLLATDQTEQFFSLVCGIIIMLMWPATSRAVLGGDFALVNDATASPEPAPFALADVAEEVFIQLRSHPVTENFHSLGADHSFAGLMRLLAVLVHSLQNIDGEGLPASLAGQDVVEFVYEGCLFASASIDTNFTSNEASIFGARCKTTISRSMAYALLVEMCANSQLNLVRLLDMMKFGTVRATFAAALPRVLDLQATTNPSDTGNPAEKANMGGMEQLLEWNYDPASFLRGSSDRIGLMNQGATCYMNSLLQQLFHTHSFAGELLRIDAGDADSDQTSVLQQLQALFGHLKLSHKKYYDTMPFCKVFRDFDGEPIQVSEQKDVYEFGTMLFDKLEMSHKDVKKLLSETFGGTLVYQVISNETGSMGEQLSERAEPYLMLTAEVKNKNCLQDSMELYVAGEPLSGDNRYEHNGKLVEALRRCAIRSLPPTLIVHLKRFEYDLTTYTKCKVNDYFSFPTELDMLPYTEEGIALGRKVATSDSAANSESGSRRADNEGEEVKGDSGEASSANNVDTSFPAGGGDEVGTSAAKDGNHSTLRTDDYYKYVLKGIVAHTGTADSGHYYSFIQDVDSISGEAKWFEFNDKDVLPFSEGSIPRECYGGVDTAGPGSDKQRVRNNNAYLLVYDRVVKTTHSVEPLTESVHKTSSEDVAPMVGEGSLLTSPAKDVAESPKQESTPRQRNRSDSLACLDHASGLDSQLPDSLQQMHPRVQHAVWHDLMLFLDDRHVFDLDYFHFNWKIFELVGRGQRPAIEQTGVSSAVALSAFQAGLRFAVDVIAHARTKACLEQWCQKLEAVMENLPAAAEWMVETLSEPYSWLTQMLVICPHSSTKAAFVNLITRAFILLGTQERSSYMETEDGRSLTFDVKSDTETTGPLEGSPTTDSATGLEDNPVQQQADSKMVTMQGPALNGKPKSPVTRLVWAVLMLLESKSTEIFSMAHIFQLLHNFSLLGVEECHLLSLFHVPHRCVEYSIGFFPGSDLCIKPMMSMLAMVICRCTVEIPSKGGSMILDSESQVSLLRRPWLNGVVLAQPGEAASIICHLCWEQDTNNAHLVYKFVVERILEATSGKTSPSYRPYFQILCDLLQMRDSLQLRRVKHCLPHLVDRCPRLSDRQAPGDEEFIFDVTKLCLLLGTHAPECNTFIQSQLSGRLRGVRSFQ